MSRVEKLQNHKIYFLINRTVGITPENLSLAREKYLKGELVEGVDYKEKR
jgi:hypothetical protein